jgi:DNA polymerase-1
MNKRAADPTPYAEAEKAEMLRHCAYNVEAASRLLDVMLPEIRWRRALFYGRFSAAVAAVERRGTPLAMSAMRCIIENRVALLRRLVAAVDQDFGVYNGLVFKRDKFLAITQSRGIDWPRLADGRTPSLVKETFEEMEFVYPEMHELRQLRATVSQLRDVKLAIGVDGRNRVSLKPFMTITGRCAPSTTEYIWGVAKWLRWLITPSPGMALCYLDFAAEEFLVAAILSGDDRMLAAYLSGDPYMATGIALGLAPRGATAISHPHVRALCKVLLLGLSYGMTAYGLARRAGLALVVAEDVLRRHRQVFERFWEWLDEWLASSRITRSVETALGWRMRVSGRSNHRSLLNWPMQSTASDILRVLTIAAVEAGVPVCALIHDAALIEAPAPDITDAVAAMLDCMVRAGQSVIGAGLRVDVQIVREGSRFYDRKGEAMYRKVAALLPGVAS